MNADWFYSNGETRLGPVTENELIRLVEKGELRPSDLVWRDGMPDWVEARTMAALFPKVEPVARDSSGGLRDRLDNAFEDDRPSRRGRARDDDNDYDRPSRRSRYAYDEDDEDDRPRVRRDRDYDDDYDRPRRTSKQKPGQIQAVAIMMLVGGIWGILVFLTYAATCIGLVWPGIYFELVVGIMGIVRASNMLGRDDQGPPKTLAIMMIICIVNLDIVACVLGIICLVMLNDEQVQAYYRKKGFY